MYGTVPRYVILVVSDCERAVSTCTVRIYFKIRVLPKIILEPGHDGAHLLVWIKTICLSQGSKFKTSSSTSGVKSGERYSQGRNVRES